jgi:hypothetical protein
MFKKVTPCIPSVGVPDFVLFIPFHDSPLPLYPPHPFFSRAFITHSSFLYLHMLQYANLMMVYHSLFSSLSPFIPYTSFIGSKVLYV